MFVVLRQMAGTASEYRFLMMVSFYPYEGSVSICLPRDEVCIYGTRIDSFSKSKQSKPIRSLSIVISSSTGAIGRVDHHEARESLVWYLSLPRRR
jgi:hypothetical protein